MKTKISIVCENSVYAPFKLIAEHGLSMLIEKDDVTLFDTGQGLGIVNNLTAIRKTAGGIDRVILSHGHYDHTGGLMPVLENSFSKMPVYLNETAFIEKCVYIPTGAVPIEIPIGMRATKDEYEKAGAEFRSVKGFEKITDGITSLSEVKRPEGWKTWDARLKQKKDGEIIDDPFNDDLSLLVETESGPVVLLGCAHAGIVEILDDLSERSGHKEFHAVIGGTHLENAPAEYVEKTIATLRKYKVKKISVSHCTGFKMASLIAVEFKNEFSAASVGVTFQF